jgi:hypothetical protein
MKQNVPITEVATANASARVRVAAGAMVRRVSSTSGGQQR